MADLAETATWEAGIYQWETTDPVIGGVGGIDNVPTLQLANRTGYLKAITDVIDAPGEVKQFARATAPTGFLKANGAQVSRTTYARLFAVIGTTFGVGDGSTTFALPDLRGEFIRGYDDGRGVDSGRGFGTAQGDLLEAHVHRQAASSDLTGTSGGSGRYADTNVAYPSNGVASNLQTASTGGTETRPRNIALLYCIRY